MESKKIDTIRGKYSSIVTYLYRGMKYEVEYSNGIDYCVTPPHIQHKDEREKIDKILDCKANKSEDSQVGLDMIFDFFGI